MESFTVSKEELARRMAMPLRDKIDFSAEKIEKWYDYWKGQIYVSFSGGKDSTVLLHLVRSIFPEIPAMYLDTGLEYPEIRAFVKTIPNCEWVKPKLSFRQVIERYGYPVISKEQSRYIYDLRRSKSEKLRQIRLEGNRWGLGKVSKKWLPLVEAPFKVSSMCCHYLKKQPAAKYERRTGRKPLLGTTVAESAMRRSTYLHYGCNAYSVRRPYSTPLAIWSEQDIWDYLNTFKVPYAEIYNMGYDRTGCMFCMYGIHQEKQPNRFQKMQLTHPKLWDYCIHNLGCGQVLDFIGVPYGQENQEA